MGTAKEIVLRVIPSKLANDFIVKTHYSHKKVNNSTLHFGVFYNNILHGVMSFGNPLDKRKVLHLVHTEKGEPVKWNEMLELNRMAFDDVLPRNSESRAISIALKLIKKNAPHIKWILTFADGTQCGDGTIYRASGFYLTGISKGSMIELPEHLWRHNGGGKYAHRMSLQAKSNTLYKVIQKELNLNGANKTMDYYAKALGTKVIDGCQFRYIMLLDKKCRLNVPVIPYSKIRESGAGMYKGETRN